MSNKANKNQNFKPQVSDIQNKFVKEPDKNTDIDPETSVTLETQADESMVVPIVHRDDSDSVHAGVEIESDQETKDVSPEPVVSDFTKEEPVITEHEVLAQSTETTDANIESTIDELMDQIDIDVEPENEEEHTNMSALSIGKYKIAVLVNGSPLQVIKVVERLKKLNIKYTFEGAGTIYTSTHNTYADAVANKKILTGRGLKPSIVEA